MASVKNLKKDIQYVLGDIIQAVYIHELASTTGPTIESNNVIEEALSSFDSLLARVNTKNVENKKAHFNQIYADLEQVAGSLVEKLNAL